MPPVLAEFFHRRCLVREDYDVRCRAADHSAFIFGGEKEHVFDLLDPLPAQTISILGPWHIDKDDSRQLVVLSGVLRYIMLHINGFARQDHSPRKLMEEPLLESSLASAAQRLPDPMDDPIVGIFVQNSNDFFLPGSEHNVGADAWGKTGCRQINTIRRNFLQTTTLSNGMVARESLRSLFCCSGRNLQDHAVGHF